LSIKEIVTTIIQITYSSQNCWGEKGSFRASLFFGLEPAGRLNPEQLFGFATSERVIGIGSDRGIGSGHTYIYIHIYIYIYTYIYAHTHDRAHFKWCVKIGKNNGKNKTE